MSRPPRLLVVAGEASADAHGAEVVRCLAERLPGVECFGLGGERLAEAGLRRIADPGVLNVVGVSEALRRLPAIRRVFRAVLAETERLRPRAALLLDLPDFNLRLARHLRRWNIPVVYYIAPQAWAWRRSRVRQIRRRVARLCAIFPFEAAFFSSFGIPTEYVGHPLAGLQPAPPEQPPKLALLPGSRPREVERLLPPILGAARILARRHPELRPVLAVAPGMDGAILKDRARAEGLEVETASGGPEALRGAYVALCASGTATLEAALLEVPVVICYKVSWITYAMVRPIFHLPHVGIVNILAGRAVAPELLQSRARPEALAAAAERLLEGPDREAALRAFGEIRTALGGRRPAPRVADIVESFLVSPAGPDAAKEVG